MLVRNRPALLAFIAAVAVTSVAACSGDLRPTEASQPPLPSIVSAQLGEVALERDAWGFTAVDWAQARARANALDLEVASGRVLVAAVSSPDPGSVAALVRDQHLAGVILMRDALVDPDQIRALTAAVDEAARADGHAAAPIISVDQEGGPVARLRGIIPDMPAFMAAGALDDADVVTDAYASMGAELRALGFTVDWAPVADVTIGSADPTIGVRSAGDDPARVARAVDAAAAGLMSAGILPAVKHFPGHGSVTADSHEGLPVQPASLEALTDRDVVPFASAVAAGIPMVMMGHIAVPEWSGLPASVEPLAYAYLREDLGFHGVAVTDALNMEALNEATPGANAVAALSAGADLLVMPADPAAARQAIIAAVADGTVPRERLDEAVARIDLMMRYHDRLVSQSPTEATDAGIARTFAAQAAVVSGPACSGSLVGAAVTIKGGSEQERASLAEALATHGVAQGQGTSVLLLGGPRSSGTADVVVALDAPWGLAQSQATVRIGLFGRSDDALAALADVLTGAEVARGTWPVAGLGDSCGGR